MPAALHVDQLTFRYDDGRAALREVDFRVEVGESVALVGPNGAGKSTLLWHCNGLLPDPPVVRPADARVRVEGEPVCAERLGAVRRRVGMMFQNSDDQLFCPTVAEDVAFGPRQWGLAGSELTERVRGCLETAGLDPERFWSRPPDQLSQGEKRRVCLAGVLACQPSILLLDEPTSDLDPRGRRELLGLLRTLPVTKVVATHDLDLAVEICPRTILLDAGQKVADGPTRAVLADRALVLAHGLEVPPLLWGA